jgi:hypothetical protein
MSIYFDENYIYGLSEDEIAAVQGLVMLFMIDDNDELNTAFIQNDDDEENLNPNIPRLSYMIAG